MFGEKKGRLRQPRVAAEFHKSNPDDRVRLIGNDSLKQTQ